MTFLNYGDHVHDFSLNFLRQHLDLLERQHYRLHTECMESPDPDSMGVIDNAESLVGLAFVACQAYISSTYPQLPGNGKPGVLKHGRQVKPGLFVADIVDAAANRWKHEPEWRLDKNARFRAACMRVLSPLRISETAGYPMMDVLQELADQSVPRLVFLADELEAWRDSALGRSGTTAD